MRTFSIIFLILFYSCSKDRGGDLIPSDEVYLKYKANGSLQQFNGNAAIVDADGVIAFKQLHGTANPLPTRYFLQAQKGANNAFALTVETDSLKPGYDYQTAPIFTLSLINGNQYFSLNSTQTLNVHVSKHESSLVSGTFSGKLYSYVQQTISDSIIITEGEFKNVRVIY